jgi:hypothetical protein
MSAKGEFIGSSSTREMVVQGNPNALISPSGVDMDFGTSFFYQKCVEEGHQARNCSKSLWGKMWKAEKCQARYIMQFPSLEKLDELIHFPELKMKLSGTKILVAPWFEQPTAKARLHTIWVRA